MKIDWMFVILYSWTGIFILAIFLAVWQTYLIDIGISFGLTCK